MNTRSDITVIRDYLGHASVATTGRYITTNLQMKRDAMQAFWKKAGIEPAATKAWKPKADLLLFLQSRILCGVSDRDLQRVASSQLARLDIKPRSG